MSTPKKKPATEGTKPDPNLLLVQQMGASTGYDPLPTEQHTCFLDVTFVLTPRAHRLLAWLRTWTIKLKRGGRTAWAHDGFRYLMLKDAATELDWTHQATCDVWDELVRMGLARKDEKGLLGLCGKVVPQGRIQGEDDSADTEEDLEEREWKKFCTKNFPGYLAKQFQQLSKNDRPSLNTELAAFDEFENRAIAEATAAIRKAVQARRDEHLQSRYHVKVRRFQRKEKEDHKPPPPVVQLSLLDFPQFCVQNSETEILHKQNGHSAPNSGESVPNFYPLVTSEVSENPEKVSEADPSAKAVNSEPPPPPPPAPPTFEAQNLPVERTEPEPVVATVENLMGKQMGAKDPLRAQFAQLPAEFQIPTRSVCRFLEEKFAEKQAIDYPIRNFGAMHDFVRKDLPMWIRQNARKIQADWKWEAPDALVEKAPDPLERLAREMPDHPQARAQKAGQK